MQVNNVLLDELPTEWNGYEVNTWFQIGIQLAILQEDDELSDYEKMQFMMELLFSDEEGRMREHPYTVQELEECIKWFLTGWQHDRRVESEESKERLLDFDVDQWRIYADFRQIYGININEAELHYWEFMGLLWNMPYELSSFLHVIEIRQKKPEKGASAEAKKKLAKLKAVYELDKTEVIYSKEDEAKIDAYDRKMSEIRDKKAKMKSQKDQEMVDEFMKYADMT